MKKMNKLVALLLAVVMVVGLMPSMTVHAHAHDHAAQLQGVEEYPVLPLDTLTRVDIDSYGKTVYFAFTPEATDLYHFYSASVEGGYADTYGSIYDAEMNLVAYNDDASYPYAIEGITGPNFCVSQVLEAGVTYILEARLYSSYSTGQFDAAIIQGHEYTSAVTKEATCTEDGVLTYTCAHCGASYEEVIPAAHSYGEDGSCVHCGESYLITGTCGDDLTWSLDWFGKLTISGTGEMYNYLNTYSEKYPAPWYDDFSYDIKTVVVEEGVTSIGNYAFYQCAELATVELAESVASFGSNSFASCYALESIKLPTAVTEIPERCFSSCGALDEVIWNENLTTIGSNAFYGCALGDTVLPEGITTIGQYAFGGCGSMTKLTLPSTLTELASYALSSMWNTRDFVFTGNAPVIGDNAFNYINATVWYPLGNETWTEEIKQNYGGTLTWQAICTGAHTFGQPTLTEATCETGSFMTSTCTVCGYTTVSPENDDALGHDFQYESYNGGCGDYSYEIVTCTRCDYYGYENYVWNEHSYTVTTVAATCTEWGYDLYECTICGDNYKSNMTEALGHSVENWGNEVEATCTEPGSHSGRCSTCGQDVTEETSPALGHNWDEENGVENDDGSITYTCTRCDATKRTEGTSLFLGDNVFSIENNTGSKTKTFTAEADGTLTIKLNALTYHNSWAYDNGYTSEYWQALGAKWVFEQGWINVFVNNVVSDFTFNGENEIIFNTVEVKAGDEITIEVYQLSDSSYYGYDIQFNLALELEVAEAEALALNLGDNELIVESAAGSTATGTWTAEADVTLTVKVPYIYYQDPINMEFFGEEWTELPADRAFSYDWFKLFVNGTEYNTGIANVEVKAGDVITVEIVNYYEYLAKVIVNLSFEGAAPEIPEGPALVLGDNEFSVATGTTTAVYNWTAAQDTTLVVEMTKLVLDFYGFPSEESPAFYLSDRSISMKINGEPVYTAKNTLELKAGDFITLQLGNTTGFDADIVVNLSTAGGHEHSYEAVVTAPTCTEGGYTTYTCECGDSYIADETAALGHTEETVPGTAPTFDNAGSTDGVICSVCGEILTAQETIPALDYNDGIIPVSALTASAGDYYSSDVPANALDGDFATMWHTDWYGSSRDNHWIQFEINGSYQVDGLRYKPRTDTNREGQPQLNGTITQFKIQVSNDGINFVDVATGSWDANQNWKTVEFDAQTVKYVRLVAVDACTDNDSVFASAAEIRLTGEETVAPPHEHAFGEWTTTKEATCTEEGAKERVCDCGEKEIEVIPALGHDFVNGKCSRCDETLTSKFEDVPAGAFYFDPVEWAVEKGITTGATATTFNPNGNCQRAQVVTFLWRAAGSPEPTKTENPFTDVKESDFYYKAVLWAVEKGITNGLTADTFGPFALCNRAQVVTFLWRAMGSPESTADVSFTDVQPGQFYSTAVAWAVENGITNGISATEFGVGGTCNRAQVVTFLYRTYNK